MYVIVNGEIAQLKYNTYVKSKVTRVASSFAKIKADQWYDQW